MIESRPRWPITELEGPTVQSHPFEEMLAGKQPAISDTGDGCAGGLLLHPVPEDQQTVGANG